MNHSDIDFDILVKLPSDYKDYGGKVERWENANEEYPDCSSGCKWFAKLDGDLGMDWGACLNRKSPRKGLLTFEHQAGKECFES